MSGEYINEERPHHVPLRPNGKSHQVIIRLVRPDRSETWRAATAVRWTDTHVLVGYDRENCERTYCWLRVDDVRREIQRPAPDIDSSDADHGAGVTPSPASAPGATSSQT